MNDIITLSINDVPNDVRIWEFRDRRMALKAYQKAWEAIQQFCKENNVDLVG